jgi:conserved domain protein
MKRVNNVERAVRFFRTTALAVICVLTLAGCASKDPQVIIKTEYKDVLVPIRCINKMPNKPKYDHENMQSARELMEYYKTCEELLKGCASQANEKSKGISNE